MMLAAIKARLNAVRRKSSCRFTARKSGGRTRGWSTAMHDAAVRTLSSGSRDPWLLKKQEGRVKA
jgi:hypothetical protein